ncbi:hypothetical protein [Tessaracoccus rhinocerotis]|uniref:hypothetical protein n=1 Tax=Tessaracoccus rhinocerotis TaxID=1689449 RepID=UPI003CCC47CE
MSPVPTGSGMTSGKRRINHGGHRQLNAAIYRTVIVTNEIPRADHRLRRPPHLRGQEQTRHHPLPETLRDPRGLPPRQNDPRTGEIRS